MKIIPIILFVSGLIFPVNAQEPKTPSPILFIYDASGSMWGQLDGKTKKEIASEVLSNTIEQLPENQNIGLVAYGHRNKGDCDDVEFLVDMNNRTKEKVSSAVKGIKPLGKTPLARSATLALNSLSTSKTKATIILVTDGIESCDGDICNVVAKAKADGIDFRLHIVGFGLKEGETEQLKCAAKAGNGNYYDASDASGLGNVLVEATSETIDDPLGNFTVYTIKNGAPIDALVRAYKAGSTEEIDAKRTYKDTSFLSLPAGRYDILAGPVGYSRVASIIVKDVTAFDDKIAHQTISFDAGKLNAITLNNDEGWDCVFKVKNQEGKVVGGTRTYGRPTEIELDPGTYDVEFAATRMNGLETVHTFEDIMVESGKTTDLEHNFKTGIAMIGVKSGEVLVDVVVSIKEKTSGKGITGSRTYTSESSNPREFTLNPGTYLIEVKPVKKEYRGQSETFTLVVKQGETSKKIVDLQK